MARTESSSLRSKGFGDWQRYVVVIAGAPALAEIAKSIVKNECILIIFCDKSLVIAFHGMDLAKVGPRIVSTRS